MTAFDIKREKIVNCKVGARLKLLRKQQSMSRKKLGTMVGISYQQIQKYEMGLNRISAVKLHQFSRIFDVSLEYFFSASEKSKGHLPQKALSTMGKYEQEYIVESMNRQFQKHIDWTTESIEADIKRHYGQSVANQHYAEIKGIATARIVRLSSQLIKKLAKPGNND